MRVIFFKGQTLVWYQLNRPPLSRIVQFRIEAVDRQGRHQWGKMMSPTTICRVWEPLGTSSWQAGVRDPYQRSNAGLCEVLTR